MNTKLRSKLKTKPYVLGKDQVRRLKDVSRTIHASVPVDFVRLSRLFLAELAKWNKTMNLISRRDEARVFDKHLLDSLGVFCIESNLAGKTLLDIGSGAGFPGIVLAAWEPRAQILLVESRAKRAAFLKSVRRTLKLDNVRVLNLRVENLDKEGDNVPPVDIVVSRGVKGVLSLVISLPKIMATGGFFVFYKGPGTREELERLGDDVQLRKLGFDVTFVRPPWQSKTTLVVVRKSATSTTA